MHLRCFSKGKALLRSRGEKLERTFAHCYETGGMRRLHLRGRDNIAKRVLIHAAAFNVGLMMRIKYGLRKPRSLSGKAAAAACALILLVIKCLTLCLTSVCALVRSIGTIEGLHRPIGQRPAALRAA